MKRPDPAETQTHPAASPSPATAGVTIGYTEVPSAAEIWARQLGLEQPLGLIQYALRSDEYLGTALNYLGQEGPRERLQRWAPEVDFVDDLLALGDAYATSPLIQKHYRPLRMDTPIIQQMKDGAMSKHPLAAVMVRRISTNTPANDAWLETLRAWWVLQYLEAKARGDKLGRRRTRIGLAIRMCIRETTGTGRWTPVMRELLGPDEDYRALHEHLVDYARRTYKQPGSESSRRDFLRALAHIDAPDDEDLEVLSRDSEPTVAVPVAPSPYSALPPRSPASVAGQLSAHWLEDLDDLPTDWEAEMEHGSTESRSTDFEWVAVDKNQSSLQQAKQTTVLQLLSVEEQQRLPYSWSKPNPHERELLKNWWKSLWRKPEHPDHDLAVLTYLAAQTCLSVRMVLRLEISSESTDDWRWDPQGRFLHRLRPRRDRSAEPGSAALAHIQPLAERLVLQTGAAVTAFLDLRAQPDPAATKLEGWFGTTLDVERRVKEALTRVTPRITPAMFGGWAAQLVFEDSDDPVLTHLLSSNSRSALPGACAYAAYDQSAASRLARLGTGAKLTAQHASATGALNSVGSALHVKDEWIKDRLQFLLDGVNSLANEPNMWLEHHNAMATYVVVALLSTSGARPVNSPFQAPSDFDLEQGTVYVEDKVSSLMHAGRLIPIDLTVAGLIRTRYLKHLKGLASIAKTLDLDLSSEIDLLSQKRDSSQIPFFFYLLKEENSLRTVEIGEKTLETLGGFTLEMQINVLRHRQSTWLKSQGADHEVINGLLGHAESGTATWGPYSARTWQADVDTVRKLLAESVKALGVSKPRLLVAPPQIAAPPAPKLSRPKDAKARYGREARAARTLRANLVAREKARQDIDRYLKERSREHNNLHLLDMGDVERLEQLMLRRRTDLPNRQRGDDLPHPRAALRYEVLCEWIQRVRDVHQFVLPVKRRYLPRLEEPSPFTADSAGARESFMQVSEWHSNWFITLDLSSLDVRECMASAIAGVIVESRVANMAVVRSLLTSQDVRVVRLEGNWYLEHTRFLDKFPTAPCTRFALSTATASALLRSLTPDDGPKLQNRVIRNEFKKLAGLLELNSKSLTYEQLFKRLCALVQQVNWQQLPGLSAGYLDGSLVSVGLDHPSWYRLHRKQALIHLSIQAPDTSAEKSESRDDSDDRAMELGAAQTIAFESLSTEGIAETEFTPVVLDSRFSAPTGVKVKSQALRRRNSRRETAASTTVTDGIAEPEATPAKITLQREARSLMKATYAAINSASLKRTSVRRDLDAELRSILEHSSQASVTCRIFVDWIRSLLAMSTNGRPLAISSISRYFVALSACFEQMAYEIDLTKCEEEEVTELYANIMQARRQLKVDMRDSETSNTEPPGDRGVADGSPSRYRTWNLALSLLRKFHRFALRHYSIEDADWSEIGSAEETLSISPRIILEREYLNALSVLVGNAEDASLDETQAGLLILLSYRFGLRAAEASNLTTADWLDGPEEALRSGPKRSRLVLVRNNRHRKLKTDNARRQVPLLFALTEFEDRLIERHWNLLDTVGIRGSVAALFPDLAGKERLGANMKMRAHVAHQLKLSCSDASVSLHTARHAFANLVASMLLDGIETLRGAMFETAPSGEWVDHVRATVLCHTKTTRRSVWGLARLMGHSHPRTALRSYIHLIPELTYARIPLHRGAAQVEQPLPARRSIDLDALESIEDYLAPPATRAAKPDHLKPTSAKALFALSMIAKGIAVPLVAQKCDLSFEHAQDLAWLEQEAVKAYGTLKRTQQTKDRLHPFAQQIRDEKLQRFRDRASSDVFDSVPWDSSLLSENLLPATMIGPSRQIVLFRPEHFLFLQSLMRQWGIDRQHLKILKSPDLAPPVVEWANRAQLQLTEAPAPLRREPTTSKKKGAPPARLKPNYQLDTVKAALSRSLALHRCVAVPAENTGALVETTYELIALLTVHLFMLRASHPELAREMTAKALTRVEAHQLVV